MLELFTRDVSASNVYREIIPNCRSRNTNTAAAETRQHSSSLDTKHSHYIPFLVGKVLSHSLDQEQELHHMTGRRRDLRRVWGSTWQGWDERQALVLSSSQPLHLSTTLRSSSSLLSACSNVLLSCTCPPAAQTLSKWTTPAPIHTLWARGSKGWEAHMNQYSFSHSAPTLENWKRLPVWLHSTCLKNITN